MTEGPKYGYSSKPSNSFVIVKHHYQVYAERIFTVSIIMVTT